MGKGGREDHRNVRTIRAVGYEQAPGIPIEEYKDFVGKELMSNDELECGLRHGTFPPGLILKVRNQEVKVVGPYGKKQFTEVIECVVE